MTAHRPPLWAQGLVAVVSLVLGTVYLELLHVVFEVLWGDVPQALDTNNLMLAGYVLVMLTGGAFLVAVLRRREGVFGHSPLDGLAVTPDRARVALVSLAAVVITLLSGAVLGPEAGLLALGTAVGAWWSSRSGADEAGHEALVKAAALGAVLSLVASLGTQGTIQLPPAEQGIGVDLVGAAVTAAAAALVIAVLRLGAYRLRGWADTPRVHVGRITAVGAAIAVVAIIALLVTDVDARFVLGSGEGFISEITTLTSLSTILIVLVAKGLAYLLSLGGGLRGGPIFPAMFLGGVVAAALIALGLPGDASVLVAGAVLAGVSVGLELGWKALTVTGIVVGLLLGGWILIPASLIGLGVGRFVGRMLSRLPGVGPVPDPAPSPAPNPT